jgi:hypothetical protein
MTLIIEGVKDYKYKIIENHEKQESSLRLEYEATEGKQ